MVAVLIGAAAGAVLARDGAPPDERAALDHSQAAIGRPVPATTLATSTGRTLALADLRGKPLIVSFIYTGCFQACPVTTQFLAQSVERARAALGRTSFNVLSIGFNQPFDTPEALGAFARQAGIDTREWHFAAPRPGEVEAITAAFGFTWYPTPAGFDHIAQVSIVDADGRIYRQVYGESFELPMLVGPLKELLSGDAVRDGGVDGLWRKVRLFCTVYDPGTGGYRLNYSLFFELFAGITFLGGVAWFMVRERHRMGR